MCELMEQYVKEEREEGKAEGKAEIIREMLKDDMSIDKIAQYANVDIKYVLKIQSNMLENEQLQKINYLFLYNINGIKRVFQV